MAKRPPKGPSRERRDLLKGVGILASALSLGGAASRAGAGVSGSRSRGSGADVRRIDPRKIPQEYATRGLARASDADLYRGVADVVSRPGQGLTSFTLHAPLELPARYGLLPFVGPADRDLARIQMVASAAVYDACVEGAGPPARRAPFTDAEAAHAALASAFREGKAGELEAAMLTAAEQFGPGLIVHWLTPLALPTLTSATHAHIGLWLVARHAPAFDGASVALLRAAARALGADPRAQLGSVSGAPPAGNKPVGDPPAELEARAFRGLLDVPKARAEGNGLRELLLAGERGGHAASRFGDLLQGAMSDDQIEAAFRGLLRASARSMLQDDVREAKFGWTHCLTLPQAACGLASLHAASKLGLTASLVWVTAFRAVLGTRSLDPAWNPPKVAEASLLEALSTSPSTAAGRVWHAPEDELDDVRRVLASEASIRNDQHLVKYVRACFDMGALDPGAVRLYLAAAAHLCAVWIAECPRDGIEEHLLEGRTS